MQIHLFELFSDMIDCIPSNRILHAIQLAHTRLEDDLLYKRIDDADQADSILSFCQFVEAAAQGDNFSPVKLPIAHVIFYEKIVLRLIGIGAFSRQVKKEFNANFCSIHLQPSQMDDANETWFESANERRNSSVLSVAV
jgi:hypothetical protein